MSAPARSEARSDPTRRRASVAVHRFRAAARCPRSATKPRVRSAAARQVGDAAGAPRGPAYPAAAGRGIRTRIRCPVWHLVHGPAARCGHVTVPRACAAASSRADRCTATMRCPTVQTDAAASSHSAGGQRVRDAQPLEAGADQRRDQALRPLDQAAVRRQPGPLGTRLDVGDDLAGDQADQRRHAQRLLAAGQAPPGDRREQHAVRDPVADRVEHRAERRAEARGRGPSRRRSCRTARRRWPAARRGTAVRAG